VISIGTYFATLNNDKVENNIAQTTGLATNDENGQTIESSPQVYELIQKGLITVQGTELSLEEVKEDYEKVPPQTKENFPLERFAETHINKILLLKEAEKQNIVVTEQEVDEQLDLMLSVSGMTYEALEVSLNGQSLDDFKQEYQDQIIVTKLIESFSLNTE